MVVDIESLEQFATVITNELEQNFIPHAHKVIDSLGYDVPFVGDPRFMETSWAFDHYFVGREQTKQHLDAYKKATEVLARAAKKVAANYRGADQLAVASVHGATDPFALGQQQDAP
jgi:hypothetical protein